MSPAGGVVLAALLGACVGSFLNVVVWRVPRGESLVRPGSRCPACKTPIRWFDNLPVLAWVLLRGRCRACRARISVRYPLVELLTAGLFALAALRHPPAEDPVFAAKVGLLSALVAISFIDLDTRLIPDRITKPGIVLGLVLSLAIPGIHSQEFLPGIANRHLASFLEGVAGMVTGGGIVWLVRWLGTLAFRKEAMGLGDVKLLAMIGTFLAPLETVYVLLLASVVGSVLGAAFVAVRASRPAPLEGALGAARFERARVFAPRGKGLFRGARPARIEVSLAGPVPAAGATLPVKFTVPKDDAWFERDTQVSVRGVVEDVRRASTGPSRVRLRLEGISRADEDVIATFAQARVAVPFGPFLAIAGAVVVLYDQEISRFVTHTWPEWVRGTF